MPVYHDARALHTKSTDTWSVAFVMARALGFEPRITVLETVVITISLCPHSAPHHGRVTGIGNQMLLRFFMQRSFFAPLAILLQL